MTKTFGNLPAGDKSQYPPVGAKSPGPGSDVVKSPGETVKKPAGPEIWNPTGQPKKPRR